jgi:hypothetical protein
MNEKFNLLNNSLEAIKKGTINLLCVKGEAGTGKSRTVLNFLKDKNVNYSYFSSYTTPLFFFKLLHDNKDKDVLIFDDIEGITDLKIIAMLKSLCWSPEGVAREVCYFSTSEILKDESLPSRFETNARIILIFNNNLHGFEAVINRGVMINFNFNFKEKLSIFDDMKNAAKLDQEVLNYVKETCDESTENLSIRSLVILSKLKKDGFDFKQFAREILRSDEDSRVLLSLVAKSQGLTVETICDEWIKQTHKSRASFFRLKKELNL